MKPPLFQIGQAVTPNTTEWYTNSLKTLPNPIFGEVYHVSEHHYICDRWYITLHEMSDITGYEEDGFDPVISDKELSKELSEIELGVTA